MKNYVVSMILYIEAENIEDAEFIADDSTIAGIQYDIVDIEEMR
jgi:hypothetical protein